MVADLGPLVGEPCGQSGWMHRIIIRRDGKTDQKLKKIEKGGVKMKWVTMQLH